MTTRDQLQASIAQEEVTRNEILSELSYCQRYNIQVQDVTLQLEELNSEN